MSDLTEVNLILGLPTVPYETLDSMKTLAGKLTKANAEIHWTTSLLITQRPLDLRCQLQQQAVVGLAGLGLDAQR
jgi:hypothetical protein